MTDAVLEQRRKQNKDHVRSVRQARIDADLCVCCGKVKPLPGKRKCFLCCGKESKRKRTVTARRKAEHRCVCCGRALPDGHTRVNCKECSAKRAEYARMHPSTKRAPRTSTTRAHERVAFAKKREVRSAAGVCISCGKERPLSGKKTCETCLAKAKERAQIRTSSRRLAHECIRCGSKLPAGWAHFSCPSCTYHRRNSIRRNGSKQDAVIGDLSMPMRDVDLLARCPKCGGKHFRIGLGSWAMCLNCCFTFDRAKEMPETLEQEKPEEKKDGVRVVK